MLLLSAPSVGPPLSYPHAHDRRGCQEQTAVVQAVAAAAATCVRATRTGASRIRTMRCMDASEGCMYYAFRIIRSKQTQNRPQFPYENGKRIVCMRTVLRTMREFSYIPAVLRLVDPNGPCVNFPVGLPRAHLGNDDVPARAKIGKAQEECAFRTYRRRYQSHRRRSSQSLC